MNQKPWTNKNGYILLADRIPLNTPLSLLIEPTNRCNFRCIFCPTGDKKLLREVGRPSGDMSLELFRKIVSDIQSFPDKLKRISLYKDGEPLCHPDLPEMIKILKDADVCNEVSTTSNAALLTEELAAKLIESGLDSIRFSVVSLSDEGYERLTRTTCDMKTVRQNIETVYEVKHDLDRSNPSIYTKIVDFNLSEEERQKFYEDFSIISDEISIDAPMNWDASHGSDLTLGKKKYIDMDEKTSLQQRQVCPRPWYTMAINFNGLVSVCCVDWSYKTIIGDVKNESLLDIWGGRKMYEFRRMHAEMRRHENPACKNCEYMHDLQRESDLDAMARTDIRRLLMKPKIRATI